MGLRPCAGSCGAMDAHHTGDRSLSRSGSPSRSAAQPIRAAAQSVAHACVFFFQAEDGIRDLTVTGFRRVLFRSPFLIFPPQVWVLKRELLWIPLIGWGLKLLRPISIDRGAGHRSVNQVIEQGKARLADGLWVIIFPEGTRVVGAERRKYGVSGALLATTTNKYVVPLSHNAADFWVRRGIVKKKGTIRVVIGTPIDATGKDPRELNDEVRRSIEAGLARIAGQSSAKTA